MKIFLSAIVKFLRHYPDAKLHYLYTVTGIQGLAIAYTVDRKVAQRLKNYKDVTVKRKLICRTLF